MTQNEKKVLGKFKEIKQGNTVAIAATLGVTINYAGDICKKLYGKRYLERLLPGMFASYRITPLGEEQVKSEGEGERELRSSVSAEEEGKGGIEETDVYECENCGAVVKEEDTKCPKCGILFEETVEEEAAESLDFSRDKLREEVPSDDSVDEKTEILNHPSVPEDWKTCNWKWK